MRRRSRSRRTLPIPQHTDRRRRDILLRSGSDSRRTDTLLPSKCNRWKPSFSARLHGVASVRTGSAQRSAEKDKCYGFDTKCNGFLEQARTRATSGYEPPHRLSQYIYIYTQRKRRAQARTRASSGYASHHRLCFIRILCPRETQHSQVFCRPRHAHPGGVGSAKTLRLWLSSASAKNSVHYRGRVLMCMSFCRPRIWLSQVSIHCLSSAWVKSSSACMSLMLTV